MRILSEQELRLMVETRPTETIAYIKQLQNEIAEMKAELTGRAIYNMPDHIDG